MIGTFLRFLFLRVIGARGAVILAVLGFLLGRRRRRVAGHLAGNLADDRTDGRGIADVINALDDNAI